MNLCDQLSAYLRRRSFVNIQSDDGQLMITIQSSGYPACYVLVVTRKHCLTPVVIARHNVADIVDALSLCSNDTKVLFCTWLATATQAA